jgi:hypothetical protein
MLAFAIGLCVLALAELLVALAAPARAQDATRYMATTGQDDGDCTEVVSPCRTVQYAVDAAGGQARGGMSRPAAWIAERPWPTSRTVATVTGRSRSRTRVDLDHGTSR